MGKPSPVQPGTRPTSAPSARAQEILDALAACDDVELPPDLEEWLGQFVGRFHVSFPFDPETYFDEQVLYD